MPKESNMKRWTLAITLVSAVAVAGCSSDDDTDAAPITAPTTTTAAQDSETFNMACEAFQALGEAQVARRQALSDVEDLSLSPEQRAEAKRTLESLAASESIYYPEVDPDECSGPVWERYHAKVRQNVAESATTTAQAAGVTWKYLQTEYSQFLGMDCGSDGTSPDFATCVGLRNAMIDSFVRDAEELPTSKARSDVLTAAERLQDHYDDWTDGYCEMEPPTPAEAGNCIVAASGLNTSHEIIAMVVNREAA